MAVTVAGVEPSSPASRAGIKNGDVLEQINGHDIADVLDYRFYVQERILNLKLADGRKIRLVKRDEWEDPGLLFDTYLMDRQRRCQNGCVFCFIDQLPSGLRESLYFKDDDSRLSFLFGNYITLTNITEHEVRRILEMHISPVNISVHTTNPELRVRMMKNKRAGEALDLLRRFAEGGIKMNCQLVLCPGLNDGEELERSLRDLTALYPWVGSVAAVPVGLTKHRQGLPELRPFDADSARQVLRTVDRFAEACFARFGDYVCYAADEFYLKAGIPIPGTERYGEFLQYENGVGMWALFKEEFETALQEEFCAAQKANSSYPPRKISVATGLAALPLIRESVDRLRACLHNLDCTVYGIRNDFFGGGVDVAGLVTGRDLTAALAGKDLGEELLLPASMFRRERDIMLDDTTLEDLERSLGVKVRLVDVAGDAFLRALLGERSADA